MFIYSVEVNPSALGTLIDRLSVPVLMMLLVESFVIQVIVSCFVAREVSTCVFVYPVLAVRTSLLR